MILNRSLAPDAKDIAQIQLIQPEIKVLDNGIHLYIFNGGEQELIRIEFIFSQLDWEVQQPLKSFATHQLLTSGTATYTAKEIVDKVDFYGAFLQTDYGNDQVTVSLYTLNKYLSAVLPMVKECLQNCIFPQRELDIFSQNQQQQLLVALEKNDFVCKRKFNKLLLQDSIYGFEIEKQHYDSLDVALLKDYYSKTYQAQNCEIIIAGKVAEECITLLQQYFGNWVSDASSGKINAFDISIQSPQNEYIEKPKAIQSALRIGKIMVNRTHPDFAALQFVNCILGGYFGSRLMANIREDKGYTYGIGSGLASLKNTGYFFIATEVGVEVCAATLQEIEKEIHILQQEKVSADELNLVRNYLLGAMLGSLENTFSHADKFKNIHFSGLNYQYYDDYTAVIKNITADEVQALAQKYLAFDSFSSVVVGKK